MARYYAGLDVADLTTAVCVVSDTGDIACETSIETNPEAISLALKPFKRSLVQVGHESGAKSHWLHQELALENFPVVCLDARHMHSLLGAQRNKTDRNDAYSIAQVLRSGWFATAYVKGGETLRIGMLLSSRRILKRKAQSLEHSLRMSMKLFGAKIRKERNGAIALAPGKSDEKLGEVMQPLVRARHALCEEVRLLDKLVVATAKADPVCKRLMTAPGVGPLTALTYRVAVDDPHRFKSSRAVAAYFGLTPKRFQSGKVDMQGSISRMGNAGVRGVLYDAAIVLLVVSKSNCRLRAWGLKLVERRGVRYAATACARKLAVILHRMWISAENFQDHPTAVLQ